MERSYLVNHQFGSKKLSEMEINVIWNEIRLKEPVMESPLMSPVLNRN